MAAPKLPSISILWYARQRQGNHKVKSSWVDGVTISAGTVVGPKSVLPPALETGLSHDEIFRLRGQFLGEPTLCFYNAQLLECLRQGRNMAANFNLLSALWHRYPDALASHLNSHWLLMTTDTFADLALPGQREAAMAVSAFVGMARLADSERYFLGKSQTTTEPFDLATAYDPSDARKELWDGITVYNVVEGDGIRNHLDRLHRAVAPYPPIRAMLEQLVARLLENDTMFARLAGASQKFDLLKWKSSATKR